MMSGADQELRIAVLLSLQQALLGMVTPDLRAVEVHIQGRSVRARFMYDGAVTEGHRELGDEVETLLIADLEDDVSAQLEVISVPSPEPVVLVRGTTYCYLRRET
jgi:hypothetical protein